VQLLNLVLTKHSKSPNAWAHRRWCWCWAQGKEGLLEHGGILSLTKELEVCLRVADLYPKNYYAWTQRSWVVLNRIHQLHLMETPEHLQTSVGSSANATTDGMGGLDTNKQDKQDRGDLEGELALVEKWLTSHVSDHSALNHRKNVMGALVASLRGLGSFPLLQRELRLFNRLINDYPGHESLWCYRRFACQAVLLALQETASSAPQAAGSLEE
ncbi:unnamed protein product, partial [Choristocarpus tenellus]